MSSRYKRYIQASSKPRQSFEWLKGTAVPKWPTAKLWKKWARLMTSRLQLERNLCSKTQRESQISWAHLATSKVLYLQAFTHSNFTANTKPHPKQIPAQWHEMIKIPVVRFIRLPRTAILSRGSCPSLNTHCWRALSFWRKQKKGLLTSAFVWTSRTCCSFSGPWLPLGMISDRA